MADHDEPATTPDDDLQFDRAEYATAAPAAAATAAVTCRACGQEVRDAYYAFGSATFCRTCSEALRARLVGGSGLTRFLAAAAFGLLAAVAGFGLYYGVAKVTGFEIGLISILVGLMVGAAVRRGAEGRGGWPYQTLAIFLTYTAIAASYGAMVIPEFVAKVREGRAAKAGAVVAKADPAGAKAKPAAAEAEGNGDEKKPVSFLRFVASVAILGVLVLAFMYALPVLGAVHSPMGFVIIGIALWEAWKLNKRTTMEVTGPYQVGAGGVAGHA
jgi:hypothetical protein